jgi:hypothetical protein
MLKCPYCAAPLDADALLCRRCGARREPGEWRAPQRGQQRSMTIVATGWLLLLSGMWSLLNLSAPVALFGQHDGAVAVLCNATFAALYGGMGAALVWRKPWALPVTLATSVAYTLEKLAFILDESARNAVLGEAGSLLGEFGPVVHQILVLVSALFLVGWWGFVLYLYLKRDYFLPASVRTS